MIKKLLKITVGIGLVVFALNGIVLLEESKNTAKAQTIDFEFNINLNDWSVNETVTNNYFNGAVEFSDNEKYLAVGTREPSVQIYYTNNWTLATTIGAGQNGIESIDWAYNDTRIIFGTTSGVVYLHETNTWGLEDSISYADNIRDLGVTPNSKKIFISAGSEGGKLANLSENSLNKDQSLFGARTRSTDPGPKNNYGVFGTPNGISIYSLNGTQVGEKAHNDIMESVGFGPKGKRLVYGTTYSDTSNYRIFGLHYGNWTNYETKTVSGGLNAHGIDFSPSGENVSVIYQDSARIYDKNLTEIRSISVSGIEQSWSNNYFAISQNDQFTIYNSPKSENYEDEDDTPSANETIDKTLQLRISPYMSYNDTQKYSVTFNDNTPENVTDNAVVTSDNNSVVQVFSSNHTLKATNDENVSKRITIRAEYTNNSETYYSNKSVTVASLTLDNVEILTPLYATIAIIGNQKIQFIIFVIIIGIGGSIATTEYGGIGLMLLCLIFGWVAGWINVGIMLSSFFFALFIFINSEIDNYEI